MIVCLGWGSLIWNPDTLPIKGGWHSDGPMLPVEFLRHSGGDRLTLVIDDDAQRVQVLWAELDVADLASAIEHLRVREGCLGPKPIARMSEGTERAHAADVAEWAAGHGISDAVWTALGPQFSGERGRRPTLDEAIAYLEALSADARAGAEEYVRMAPRQVMTPYRRAFEERFGWTPLGDI